MKVFYSPYSPFVRKVLVSAHELGLSLEQLANTAHPVQRDRNIVTYNPLGQVPTLLPDEGDALYDSRVICEYLDTLANGALFPRDGAPRWRALTDQALADGMLGACLLMRYEQVVRPEEIKYPVWFDAQREKIDDGLAYFEQHAAGLGDRVDIGTISLACVIGYLELRFPEYPWQKHVALAAWHARFSQRPSMLATRHPA